MNISSWRFKMSWKSRIFGLALYISYSVCSALGVDKLVGELNVTKGFNKVITFTLFNDRDDTIFITSKGLAWDMDKLGNLSTVPSNDLEIFPPVHRVNPGDSAVFKVRYVGDSIEGEGLYRVMFNEILIPTPEKENEKLADIKTVTPNVGVGMAITVPVYVSDFSKKEKELVKVVASYKQNGRKLSLFVKNMGDSRINIRQYILNGTKINGLGTVLARHERLFNIDTTEAISSLVLQVVHHDKIENIIVIRE
jgi:P pilus assembly chaperone PapD